MTGSGWATGATPPEAELLAAKTVGSFAGAGFLAVTVGLSNGVGPLPITGKVDLLMIIGADIPPPNDDIPAEELPAGIDTGDGAIAGMGVPVAAGDDAGIDICGDDEGIMGIDANVGDEVIAGIDVIIGADIIPGIDTIIGADIIPGIDIGPADITARPSSDSTLRDAPLLNRRVPASRSFLG